MGLRRKRPRKAFTLRVDQQRLSRWEILADKQGFRSLNEFIVITVENAANPLPSPTNRDEIAEQAFKNETEKRLAEIRKELQNLIKASARASPKGEKIQHQILEILHTGELNEYEVASWVGEDVDIIFHILVYMAEKNLVERLGKVWKLKTNH